MKLFYARSLMAILATVGVADLAVAQDFGSGSLLPIPSSTNDEVRTVGYTRYAARNRMDEDSLPRPAEPAPMEDNDVGPVGSSYSPAPAYATPPMVSPNQMAPSHSAGHPSVGYSSGGSCEGGNCGPSAPSSYIPSEESCGPNYLAGYTGCNWFVQAGGLIMGRSDQGRVPFTYDNTYLTTLMTSHDVNQKWSGGFQITAGRIIGCGNAAIGATYWGLYPQDSMITYYAPATGLRSPIHYDHLLYPHPVNGPTNVGNYYTGANFHYLSRSSTYNNVEVNLYSNPAAWGFMGGGCGTGCGSLCNSCDPCGSSCGSSCGMGCGPRLQCGWLAGFRYFNFNEAYSFTSNNLDPNFMPSSPNQITHILDYKNNLYGFQMGGIGNVCLGQHWSAFGIGKAGVFNNHIDGYQRVYGTGGDAYVAAGNYAGTNVAYRNSRNGFATMGELDLGVRYQCCRWNLFGGYRVVGFTGMATPAGNVPYTFNDPRDQQRINSNDTLVLHGFFAGGSFCF
jgi:hypothetical protein